MALLNTGSGGGGGAPSGAAGGDLTGTYPDPTIATGKVTSTAILNGTILDADVNASAAIAIAKLADPTAGFVIGSAASAAAAVRPPGYEWAYDALTTTVTTTQTVQASATSVLAGTATTYDGAAVMVEIGAVVQISDPGTLYMTLWKDGVDTARVQQFNHSGATAGSTAFRSSWRDTPSAGSHTYALKVFVSAGTGTVYGSATASMAPAFIRVVKV